MGENVLAAIQEFARVLAGDPQAPSPTDKSGYAYFDLLGKVMVSQRAAMPAATCWARPL